jgi:hypothetical protein
VGWYLHNYPTVGWYLHNCPTVGWYLHNLLIARATERCGHQHPFIIRHCYVITASFIYYIHIEHCPSLYFQTQRFAA